MATFSTGPVGQDLTSVGTVPNQGLGQSAIANDGVYQYVKAAGAIAQYAFVKIAPDYTAVEVTGGGVSPTEPAKIGCAQVAIPSGSYGWVFVGPGSFTGKFAAACVQNTKILLTGTPGVADDTGAPLLQGVRLNTTIVGAQAAPAFAVCAMTVGCQD